MFDIDYLFKDNNFSGVVLLLDKHLNVIRFNENFGELQGYKKTDIYMKPFVDIVVPEDKSVFFESTFAVENSKEFTIQCYHKQGAFRYFSFNMINFKEFKLLFGKAIKKEFNSYTYVDESLNYLEKAINNLDVEDISEIVAKDDLNMSIFLSMFPIDIWIKDRFNRYVFVNDIYTVHTGHTLNDVYLRDDFQLFPRDIAKGFTSSDQEAIQKGKKINYTFYASLNKFLSWTEVTKIPLYNVNRKFIGLLGFSSDVSESRLIEEKSNTIINKHSFVLNELDVLVVELNLEGNIIFASGRLLKTLGLKEEELLKKNIFIEHQNSPEIEEVFNLVLKGETKTIHRKLYDKNLKVELHPHLTKEKITSVIAIATVVEGDTNE